MSERWGAFSVIDHKDAAALAADVLLYDQLLIPVPPDDLERKRWKDKLWDPDLQDVRLNMLGNLVRRVEWNQSRQQMYEAEVNALRAKGFKVNGYAMTGAAIAKEAGVD